MIGAPGAGKSMLAARLPSILPPRQPAELLEVSMIALGGRRDLRRRADLAAAVPRAASFRQHGGPDRRRAARPARRGLARASRRAVPRRVAGVRRRRCSIRCASRWRTAKSRSSRANHRVTYPARFMLVAAMNPCRCGRAYEPGYAGKRGRLDRCTADYQARISGPLMDRIDLRIEVPAVSAADLILPPPRKARRRWRPGSPRRAICSASAMRRSACRR